MERFPKQVKIVEVGPRDGLQNEKITIPTSSKIDFINRLSETGLNTIECTSFVSPKWIPQLADGKEVLQRIKKHPNIHYLALVPNVAGFEHALSAGAKEIAVFCAASETFSEKNTHCTIAQSLNRIEAVLKLASEHQIPVRGYVSCSLGCPYEGAISPKIVADLSTKLFQMGCHEISLGDTIGVGTPRTAKILIETTAKHIPISSIAVHFHDTYGQALTNIYACLELGISIIDSSIAGLGGCPYAKGATGNVATEDVVYLLHGLEIQTGIDLEALVNVSQFISELTHQTPRSKVAKAMLGMSS